METGTVDIPLPAPVVMKPVQTKVIDGNICLDSENFSALSNNLLTLEKTLFLIYSR